MEPKKDKDTENNLEAFEIKYIKKENFEEPDISLVQMEKKRRFLKIEDLKKQYDNGFQAVNGINVRMYEG